MLVYPIIAAVVIAADQITKYMVRANMKPGESIPVIGDWFRIMYVRNTGTAFSMFEGNKLVTLVLTSVLIIACFIFMIVEAKSGEKVTAILLAFICAGGISNLIDRIVLGFVTDMISCGSFAVFNVADIAVTCGCILLALYMLLTMRSE